MGRRRCPGTRPGVENRLWTLLGVRLLLFPRRRLPPGSREGPREAPVSCSVPSTRSSLSLAFFLSCETCRTSRTACTGGAEGSVLQEGGLQGSGLTGGLVCERVCARVRACGQVPSSAEEQFTAASPSPSTAVERDTPKQDDPPHPPPPRPRPWENSTLCTHLQIFL